MNWRLGSYWFDELLVFAQLVFPRLWNVVFACTDIALGENYKETKVCYVIKWKT